MEFGNTTTISSLPLTRDLPDLLYPASDGAGTSHDADRHTVELIVDLLLPVIDTFPKGYNLIVVQEAMNAFSAFADEIYARSHKEAAGLFAGYYLHNPDDPEVKVAVATTFLEARGDATTVTCEVSYQDSCRAVQYCDEHGLLILVWTHSHPGFGVFYSDTDTSTLMSQFSAEQLAGIVVDNLQDRYLAYKVIGGRQEKIPIWGFSLEDGARTGSLDLFQYLDAPRRASFSMRETRGKVASGKETPQASDLQEIRSKLESMERILEEINRAVRAQSGVKAPAGGSPLPLAQALSRSLITGTLLLMALTFAFALGMHRL